MNAPADRRLRGGLRGVAGLHWTRVAARRSGRAALAFALGLGGCGGAPAEEGPLPPDVLVRYQRSGGIAGFQDEVVVERGGRATITAKKLRRPTTLKLSPQTMQRLERALERANFDRLKSNYGGSDYPDAIGHLITYQDKTVQGGDLPPEVAPAVTILFDTINREVYNYPSSDAPGQP